MAVLAIGILLVFCAVWFDWRGSIGSEATGQASLDESEKTSIRAEAIHAPTEGPARADVERRAEVTASLGSASYAAHGRLRVVDDVNSQLQVSGRMDVSLLSSNGGDARSLQVEVVEGIFLFEVAIAETICKVHSVTAGPWLAEPVNSSLALSPNTELLVDVKWAIGTLLRVVDADTKAELDNVECVAQMTASLAPGASLSSYPPHQIRKTPFIVGQQSPLSLPAAVVVAPCWVRAPGYAWSRVWIEGRAGERRAELMPECRLEIKLTDLGLSNRSLLLRLSSAINGTMVLSERVPSGALLYTLDGLQPQTVEAELRQVVGGVDLSVASATLELLEGKVTTWAVSPAEGAASASAGIQLVVVPPPDCALDDKLVAIVAGPEGRSSQNRTAENFRELKLTRNSAASEFTGLCTNLVPGKYTVWLPRWNASRAFTLLDSQFETIVVTVEQSSSLTVKLTTEEGAELDSAGVAYAPDSDIARQFAPEQLLYDAEQKAWIARLEPGPLTVLVGASGFTSIRREIELAPGGTTVSLVLARSASLPITITIRESGALYPIDIPSWIRVVVEPITGPGTVTSWEFVGASGAACATARVIVSSPGRYRIIVPTDVVQAGETTLECDISDESGASVVIERIP